MKNKNYKKFKILASLPILFGVTSCKCEPKIVEVEKEKIYPDFELFIPGNENSKMMVKSPADYGITAKPNIIYILLDDAGFSDFSCYGQSKMNTPNIDKLAQQGIRFNQHYAGASVSSPSRAALLTGKHTGHTSIRGNKERHTEAGKGADDFFNPDYEGQFPIATDIDGGFVSKLKENGYKTAMVGKWGMGVPATNSSPKNLGFEKYYSVLCQRQSHSYFPDHVWQYDGATEQSLELVGNKKLMKFSDKTDEGAIWIHDKYEEKTLEYITEFKTAPATPYFLYCAFNIPHGDIMVSDKTKINDSSYSRFAGADWWNSATDVMKKYSILIDSVDKTIGKIMDAVDGTDTIIIFTSDNGPSPEYGVDVNFFESSGRIKNQRLKDLKTSVYEGGIRVPFIVSWKNKIQTGGFSDHLFAAWDVGSTIAQIVDFEWKNRDGISFLPTLVGDTSNQKLHNFLYWEFVEYGQGLKKGPRQALRVGDYKAIIHFGAGNTGISGQGDLELYNISVDPGELYNIASSYPKIVDKMRELFKTARTNNDNFPQIRDN